MSKWYAHFEATLIDGFVRRGRPRGPFDTEGEAWAAIDEFKNSVNGVDENDPRTNREIILDVERDGIAQLRFFVEELNV